MADHLAQRFGTEKDRVNCPFYIKIGCGPCVSSVVCMLLLGMCSVLTERVP